MNPLPSGSFREKKTYTRVFCGLQARCLPLPLGHFFPGKESEGRGGTDVLIPQPYNERQ